MNPNDVHTAGTAVPSVDGTDLGGTLADLDGVHPGIDLIRDGLRLIAHERHDLNTTQVLIAMLAGSPDGTDVIGAIGQLVARLTNPHTNPCLRNVDLDAQKQAELQGDLTRFHLTDPELRENTARANAALDNH